MTTPPAVLASDTSSSTATRITNLNALTVLRALWVIMLIVELVLLVVLIPVHLDPASHPVSEMSALEQQGIVMPFLMAYGVIGIVLGFVALILSAMMMWRSHNERTAILFSFIFLISIVGFFSRQAAVISVPLSNIMTFFNNVQLLVILYLFPNGRFAPPWMGYIFAAALLFIGITVILGFNELFLFNVSAMIAGVGSFIYRYRHTGAAQRQQIKWLIPPLLAFPLIIILWWVVFTFVPDPASTLIQAMFLLLLAISFFAMLFAVGLAIFRYRLWDVDLVVNRSLVYGAVTVLLVLVFSLVIAVVSTLTQGQGQLVGVVLAAVAAGAFFNPSRHRIQRFVDHRIYRLRYDLNEVAEAQKKPDIKNPGIYTGRTFGQYEILGVLGKGGMGEVYKGIGEGRTVAVKVLTTNLAQRDEFRKRFTREAQTLAGLEHPNIVRLFASGMTDDGVHYLAMEYIDGQEAGEVIEPGGMKDYDSLREWITDIGDALDYIHAKGLVHRDLKPSNIMLRKPTLHSRPLPAQQRGEIHRGDPERFQAVVMDFGIARVDASGTRLTGSGAVGTIDYMSPEQIMAAREVDKRADIYALGIILYELLTGERPFKGSAGQVLFAHLQQPPPDPRDVNPAVPRHIALAVMKALAKNPHDRFASAGEFAATLV